MQASQSPPRKLIMFKEVKLTCPKNDMASIPFINNKWIAPTDMGWYTPAIIFHNKVMGDGIVEKIKFMEDIQPLPTRMTTQSELNHLAKLNYIAKDTPPMVLVDVESLLQHLTTYNNPSLAPTVASLLDIPLQLTNNAHLVVEELIFPHSIPSCSIGEEELMGTFSLSATYPHMCEEGTKWAKQLVALRKIKEGECHASPTPNACIAWCLPLLFTHVLRCHCRSTHHHPWQGHQGWKNKHAPSGEELG